MSAAGEPRLQPLPTDCWGDEARAALSAAFGEGVAERFLSDMPDAPRMPNALTTLMHHPGLAGPFLTYNAVILEHPALGHRMRELMVLRVAWRTGSDYEWEQHIRLAARFGVTRAEIDAIAGGVEAHSWTPLESDLLAATDQLIDGYRIDDATWARLAEHLDARQLVELVFVVGTYTCLAMAFNSFGLQLDPELQAQTTTARPESEE
ncbi:MAG: carboxymuconolactone decarboxylase family protein [Acidimicrobiia bacterium]